MTEKQPSPIQSTPVFYLFYGDDRSAMQDQVARLVERVSDDPGMRDLNTTRLEGKQAGGENIHAAAYALPFLTNRRLVILYNPFEHFKSTEDQQRLLALLEGLPASTALVLVVDDSYIVSKNFRGWQTMQGKAGKFLLDWVEKNPELALQQECRLPKPAAMPAWILNEARKQEGRFSPQAAAALAALTGSDTGLARQEIIKLLTYVDRKRAVSLEDVQEAAAPGGEADVFSMVDAMALGDAPAALRQLGKLLEGQDTISLFGMIVRQFRLLILTKEAILEGVLDKGVLAKRLGTTPWVAEKMLFQAKGYSLSGLEEIYHRLLEMDRQMKTSQIDADVALQAFVAELAF